MAEIASRVGHAIWVCVDCMFAEAYDESPENPDREPWALWENNPTEIAMGLLYEDHECDDPENCWEKNDAACERISFTWSACEGCGSSLGGERHAFTWWEPSV